MAHAPSGIKDEGRIAPIRDSRRIGIDAWLGPAWKEFLDGASDRKWPGAAFELTVPSDRSPSYCRR
jgi:hypothetical protein